MGPSKPQPGAFQPTPPMPANYSAQSRPPQNDVADLIALLTGGAHAVQQQSNQPPPRFPVNPNQKFQFRTDDGTGRGNITD